MGRLPRAAIEVRQIKDNVKGVFADLAENENENAKREAEAPA
jgi:hypothetical protein